MAQATSILGRRGVPLTACWAMSGVSTLGAVSAVLQPGLEPASRSALVVLCVLLAAVGAGLALGIDRPMAVRLRGRVRSSLLACAVLTAGLTVVALGSRGLSSVSFTGVILIATYVGLVMPRLASRATIGVLIALEILIEALQPAVADIDAVAIVAVTLAGWSVGVLGNRAHGRSAHLALVLSRTDALTRSLNRRGFFEEFEAGLQAATDAGQPYALLVLDLDAFKAVNDTEGHAAGDRLLTWVGETLGRVVPAGAAVGRLGGDEFAVALPATGQAEADVLAVSVASALGERIGASVGVAVAVPGSDDDSRLDADDLVRIADAELYAVKRGLDVHLPVVQTTSRRTASTTRDPRRVASPTPVLRYEALARAGGAPAGPETGVQFGWLIRGGCLVVGAAGLVIGAVQLAGGGDTVYDDILRVALAPWVLLIVGLGLLNSGSRTTLPGSVRSLLVYWVPTALLGAGVSVVLLAGRGIDGALVSGFFLKVMFDAFVLPRRHALGTLLVILAWWGVVAAVGPADALWAAPVQLGIFLASFAVATTANRAYVDVTRRSLALAHADPLTGLRNRTGLEAVLATAPRRADEAGRRLAVVLFDLDDFKGVNDRLGHAAGDEILMRVARATRAALPGAYGIGRIGGDEFVAAVPVDGPRQAAELEAALRDALEPIVGVSIGSAVMPDDGPDVATLMGVADLRSYERKAASIALARALIPGVTSSPAVVGRSNE